MPISEDLRARASAARIFFFDIDGTLVRFMHDRMSDQTRRDLDELRRLGYKLYVASGRAPSMMDNVRDFVFDGYIGLNGQYCVRGDVASDNPEVLRVESLHQTDIRSLIEYLKSAESDESVMFLTADGAYINRVDQYAEEVGRTLRLDPWQIADPSEFLETPVFQLLAFGTAENEHRILELMPNAEYTRWHPSFIDVIPQGGGKHLGLRAACQAEGIPLELTVAFGDGDNDLTMIQEAGLGIAMANATHTVRAAADWMTLCVDEDGVSYALRELGILS